MEESLALLDTLLRGAPDGLGFLDRELRWVRLNEALAAALKTPVAQLLGRPIGEHAAGVSPVIEHLVRRVLETGEPLVDHELSGEPTAAASQQRHHLISLYPVRNTSGELLGVGMVVVDITERKQAENEVRESEERYRRVVETANEGIWLIDAETRTMFINQRMAGMLGYAPADIVGHSVLEFVNDQSETRERIGQNLAGISEQLEFPFRHRDGSTVLALGGTSPITNGRGDIVGALGMFSDITERKRVDAEREQLLTRERAARDEAEAAQRQLALLARASELLAASLDYEATLRQIAWLAVPELADWCAVFLADSGETLGIRALAYANPVHAELARELERDFTPLDARLPDVWRTGRAELFPDDGDDSPEMEISRDELPKRLRSIGIRHRLYVPMRARGRTLGVLGLAMADSGRRYQPEDVTLAQQLADRCAVALDNAVLVGELRQALGVGEELLAATSHELRTPLAHIKGFTSTLRQPDVEWDEATRQDFLAEIEREADRLGGLITDLLNMSRLESGAMEQHPRVPVAPAVLVSAGLDRVRGLLGNAQVQVDVASNLPSVVVDAASLEHVVGNLVENAAKYGPSNVQIRITGTRVDGELELAVTDDGPGIRDDDLERVFDKFFRARSTDQSGVPGTGLGLAICRAIVEAHRGRIWAENRDPRGARLVVRLPLQASAAARRA
jgi:PAS domain S-box-containing protein